MLIFVVFVLKLECLQFVPDGRSEDIIFHEKDVAVFKLSFVAQSISERDLIEAIAKVVKGYRKFSATPRYLVYN